VEYRACGEGCLVFTGFALIQMTCAVKRGLIMAASWTAVSVGPPNTQKMLLACLFDGKLLLKLNQAHRGLL
jgi:hypothetical protein